MSIFLSTVSPFSLLFILFVISDGEYLGIAVAGSLVMTMVSFGLALGEDIAYYKLEYKIQDMFISSPVSQVSYMIGLGLSELLFGLPAIVLLIVLAIYLGTSVTLTDLVYVVSSSILGYVFSNWVSSGNSFEAYKKCKTDLIGINTNHSYFCVI
jgi:ABC-2 type transport system permease protein